MGGVVELVEGNPPRALESTAALLNEDILERLRTVVEAQDTVVEEVAHEEVLACGAEARRAVSEWMARTVFARWRDSRKFWVVTDTLAALLGPSPISLVADTVKV